MQTLGVAKFTSTTTTPHAFTQRGGATPYRRSQPVAASASRAATPKLKQVAHSMPPEKIELFKSLEPWASENVLPLLKPVEQCWQPNQLLPDPARPVSEFMDDVRALRERTKELPDEYFVVLVGDMVTEDAVPTYQTMLNTADGTRDETGSSPTPWATWTRAWTAEENRHGDLLRSYLYLSGRVDMLMIERTVQYLIGAGMVSLLSIHLVQLLYSFKYIIIHYTYKNDIPLFL